MRKKVGVALLLVVSFILGFALSAAAYSINVSGGIKNRPAALVSYSGFSNETVNAIYYSCQTWTYGIGYHVVDSAGWRHNNNYFNQSSDGENRVTKGFRPTSGTDVYLMRTHWFSTWVWGKWYIIEADIDINVSFPFDNNGESASYDIQNVMTHEVGHMLGLGHSDVYDATMYKEGPVGETSKRSLYFDDLLAVEEIYN